MGRKRIPRSCLECSERDDCVDSRVCPHMGYDAFWG